MVKTLPPTTIPELTDLVQHLSLYPSVLSVIHLPSHPSQLCGRTVVSAEYVLPDLYLFRRLPHKGDMWLLGSHIHLDNQPMLVCTQANPFPYQYFCTYKAFSSLLSREILLSFPLPEPEFGSYRHHSLPVSELITSP